jgi:hypothetical protein
LSNTFKKFEKKLINQYVKAVDNIKTYSADNSNFSGPADDQDAHNLVSRSEAFYNLALGGPGCNTNMTGKEHLLFSHLPIMHKTFQQRLNVHSCLSTPMTLKVMF